ncbi:SLIT and NTRK-like protein 4 [Lutzomyia longipalpis]|uniref:SLIT and NTRK-like protein 4 n=1 Tax=Lutzomyia longipalpis TaxID=7200 RepID=UPI002483803E|nr:SLIT and NTRK-like protein 4 [Lutzomyia longipalpis]
MRILLRILLLAFFSAFCVHGATIEDDEAPFEPGKEICTRCNCALHETKPNYNHFLIDCSAKDMHNVPTEWPSIDGSPDIIIVASFSGNEINTLHRLPQADYSMHFSCRHCELKVIEVDAFLDVPKILRLDLSWNHLTGETLRSDTFRGRFSTKSYEPIALEELNLSHNQIRSLERKIFEHLPRLKTLSLAHNPVKEFDPMTTAALCSLPKIEHLDLSYMSLSAIPDEIFQQKPKLRELLLQGNDFHAVPESLSQVGKSLKSLYIGVNPIEELTEQSFLGLTNLVHLNVSFMPNLVEVREHTFSELKHLEMLMCSDNPQMTKFDVESLRSLKSLRELHLSNCSLKTLNIEVKGKDEQQDDFPKLRLLKLESNPWHCDCGLLSALQELEHHGRKGFYSDDRARCATPYDLSGTLLPDLFKEPLCSMEIRKTPRIPIYEPASFLRPKSILLSIFSVIAVVAIGLAVGCTIVCIKKKLKQSDFGFTTPVRYTTVRESFSTTTSVA